MSAFQFLPGLLAVAVGIALTLWHLKAKRPKIAILAGAVFLFPIVWFWRCFSPAPQHHPFTK